MNIFGINHTYLGKKSIFERITSHLANQNNAKKLLINLVDTYTLNTAYADKAMHYSLEKSDYNIFSGQYSKFVKWICKKQITGITCKETFIYEFLSTLNYSGSSVSIVVNSESEKIFISRLIQSKFNNLNYTVINQNKILSNKIEILRNILSLKSSDAIIISTNDSEISELVQNDISGISIVLNSGRINNNAYKNLFTHSVINKCSIHEYKSTLLFRNNLLPSSLNSLKFLYRFIIQKIRNYSHIEPTNINKLMASNDVIVKKEAIKNKFIQFLISRIWQIRNNVHMFAKRMLDIFISVFALFLLSPILVLTAIAIKLESNGPALFSQLRVGVDGKEFKFYKFRSMFLDAEDRLKSIQHLNESPDGVLFKMKNDPRITKVGKVIRKFSIDELPQIYNVLIGDMSIVGPRPPLPKEVYKYDIDTRKRLQTKPGLTCYWQISGRSNLSFEQQKSLDIRYMRHQSVFKDILIILKTIPAVISGKGAY